MRIVLEIPLLISKMECKDNVLRTVKWAELCTKSKDTSISLDCHNTKGLAKLLTSRLTENRYLVHYREHRLIVAIIVYLKFRLTNAHLATWNCQEDRNYSRNLEQNRTRKHCP